MTEQQTPITVSTTDTVPTPPPEDPVIEGHLAQIRARFRGELSEEQIEQLRAVISFTLVTIQKLEGYPLPVADEPLFLPSSSTGGWE